MHRTFGEALWHFSRSIDLVDDAALGRMKDLLEEYIVTRLKCPFYEVLNESWVGKERGLKTLWTRKGEREFSLPLKQGGKYCNHTAFAYDRGSSLWITASDGGPLAREEAPLVDHWSSSKALPPYQSGNDFEIRTSIMLPLKHPDNRIFGVFNVESDVTLSPSARGKQELSKLAAALSELFSSNAAYQAMKSGTAEAANKLHEFLSKGAATDIFTKPRLFVASSDRADNAAMGIIEAVAQRMEDSLEVKHWRTHEPGDINQHIQQSIAESQFAICYLSEPDTSKPGHFVDNPNVLFEAGILHGAASIPKSSNRVWIPIREQNSPTIPFDLGAQRLIMVPRHANGTLNAAAFKADLEATLKRVLGRAQS